MGVNSQSVRSRRIFGALRTTRIRAKSGPIRISFVDDDEIAIPAIAFAISRKVGGAVVRNRIRRRLRAIIAELVLEMPIGAYLISVSPETATLTYKELKANVTFAISNIAQNKAQ